MKNVMTEEVISYIIEILLGTKQYRKDISFGKLINQQAKINIIDSGFFDEENYLKSISMPKTPLSKWHGIPLLYGRNEERYGEGGVVIYADLIASSFFMLSRYEELINLDDVDIHGRINAYNAITIKERFIARPIVDEYGVELRKIMRKVGIDIEEPNRQMKIYLTHDVDTPWKQWTLKSAIRTIGSWIFHFKEFHIWPLLQFIGVSKYNPYDTFEWMISTEKKLKKTIGSNCQDMYFILGAEKNDKYTDSYIFDPRVYKLVNLINDNASEIGLHIGYSTGENNSVTNIVKEKQNIETLVGKKVKYGRYHYLRALGMESFRNLIKAGITDDFTMGYAQCAGFRLGTSQCVNWIDPESMSVTNLKLHPLIIMDGSLSGYMRLSEEEAFEYFRVLFENVKRHKGEFIVLFHNSSFKIPGIKWMESFYVRAMDYINSNYSSME